MKKKTFDCVRMKRQGASLVQQRIGGMTPEQELAFWRQRTEELRRVQQELGGRSQSAVPAPGHGK